MLQPSDTPSLGTVVKMAVSDISGQPDDLALFHSTHTTRHSNGSIPFANLTNPPPCQWILYEDIGTSRVRIWDLIILIPNVLFLCFLLWHIKGALLKLKTTSSPIFTAFYILVMIVALISILRCIVAMTVNASMKAGDLADKLLWLILRFFLLATELSVVIFGLAFGHLDSKTSIRRVLIVTSLVALAYSITQGTLELKYPDEKFHVKQTESFDIFAHGGMLFWLSSSIFFFIVYSLIFILPWTFIKDRVQLPAKKSFYYYALFLALLNIVQAVGSALIYFSEPHGYCVVDVSVYVYFTLFDPLVYGAFLRDFFKKTQPNILFSYKHQVDETAEDNTVSMPYQTPYAKVDPEEATHSGSYDSTHFDRQNNLLMNGSVNDDFDSSVNSTYYQVTA